MTQFITDPATVNGLLAYAIFVSLACGLNFILWRTAHESNKENYELSEALRHKVDALTMADEESADVICDLKAHNIDLSVLLDDSKAANKELSDTNAHLADILLRSYVRNKYGIIQAYQDWAVNGDRKPKPRSK